MFEYFFQLVCNQIDVGDYNSDIWIHDDTCARMCLRKTDNYLEITHIVIDAKHCGKGNFTWLLSKLLSKYKAVRVSNIINARLARFFRRQPGWIEIDPPLNPHVHIADADVWIYQPSFLSV